MRKRRAYSINVKTTPLKAARAYAEQEFEKKGRDLDEVLPDFDRNYVRLQKRLKGALEIPRIGMPVIEPSDMALFNKRLNSGAVDVFAPYAKGKLYTPSSLSKDEGEEWVELGFKDGDKSDDVIKGKLGGFPVGKMKPTQSQIWFDKIVKLILQYGPAKSGSPILSQTVIVSGDNYILDGHHRYAQAMIADPSLKMRALRIPLPIELLLKVGKTYGESIGNSAKASVGTDRRVEMARSLVKMAKAMSARELTAKTDAASIVKDAFGLPKVDKAKMLGDSRYGVAIGQFRGKWYGVEERGPHPQIWEERSLKALLSKIEADTGVRRASEKTAAPPTAGLSRLQVKVAQKRGEKIANEIKRQVIRAAYEYEGDERLNPGLGDIFEGMAHVIADEVATEINKFKRMRS